MKNPIIVVLFLAAAILFSGCSQVPSPDAPDTTTRTPLTTPAPLTTSILSATVSPVPTDPVVGTWVAYIYPSWGKTKLVITCHENKTWTRNISQYKGEKTEFGHGIWIKQNTAHYDLKSSLGNSRIFNYNSTADKLADLTDPDFLIYSRSTDGSDPFPPPSPQPTEIQKLTESHNFTDVARQLTTPNKVLRFMQGAFTFDYHGGLISYTPEKMFEIRKGDCKDYATFFSAILAQHGYYAEIVTIKYDKKGHTVTIFRDDDGQLKYQSSDKMDGFRNVSGLDDLLQQEIKRMSAGPIVRYRVLHAGSVDMCTMPDGHC